MNRFFKPPRTSLGSLVSSLHLPFKYINFVSGEALPRALILRTYGTAYVTIIIIFHQSHKGFTLLVFYKVFAHAGGDMGQ